MIYPSNSQESHPDDTEIVIIDTETTGFSPQSKVIELGMIRCRYGSDGHLCGIDEKLDMLEDPGEPLADEIVRLTGITDEMVRGKSIDCEAVAAILHDDPIVVAHNAKFDRPFFERIMPNTLRWKCTVEDIPWADLGHGSAKLEELLIREGWFYDAHRAYVDCMATAWLLHIVENSLCTLLQPTMKVIASGSSFAMKPMLKERGYWWNPQVKVWWKKCKQGHTEFEHLEKLYENGNKAVERQIDPRIEFK